MNTLIFGLLAVISLLIFTKLGKIKASTKQLNRDNRIRWKKNQNQNFSENGDNSKIADRESKQISDQSDE